MKYLIALLAVAGMAVSSIALHIHLMDPNAAPPCAVSEHWDCGAVGHSRFSWFPPKMTDEMSDALPGSFHLPIAAIGIAGYAAIAIFALLGQMEIVFEMAQIGFFFAAFLSYIEAYIMEMWCIYCVWSQILISLILLLSVLIVLPEWWRRRAALRVESKHGN
jgi:uncharacterized membrane protein